VIGHSEIPGPKPRHPATAHESYLSPDNTVTWPGEFRDPLSVELNARKTTFQHHNRTGHEIGSG